MVNGEIKKRLKNQTLGYLLSAFGFVAALAWNDAIRSFIEFFFPFANSGVLIKFIYAILITVFVVLVGQYIFKLPLEE